MGGAHSSATMAFNEGILAHQRPNIFELLEEEAMHETLRPAVEYICKVAARSRPDWFGVLWRSRDELYLVLESALQWCFLKGYDSAFSEYFYCLRRRSTDTTDRLSVKRKVFSLVCLVLVPYVKVKVERLYSILTDENDSSQIMWSRGQSKKQLLKFIIFKLIPYLQSLWTALFFLFRLCYLMNKSDTYSPLHWLAGVKIVRQMDDNMESLQSAVTLFSWSGSIGHIFSIFLFCLKLLEWWYSQEGELAFRKMSSLPVPPPPPKSHPSSDGLPLPSDHRLCPICREIRREPTALSTSGYVFCYDCIAGYITNFGKCPVTSLPSSHVQLIQIFTDQQ